MATPIQHTSQFIPTDIGVLERNLADTQQRADSAYQGLLQADSQFANVLATNQDNKVKENIIGEFRNKSGEVLKKYGNDYAKASKELAREVVNAGNNPFWQLNAAKQRGIDTYNQMKVKMGSDAIDGYNPASTPIYNEQSKQYTSPEEFNPTIYSSSTLNKGLEEVFSPRMSKLNETLMQRRGPTGILTAETTRGIINEEVPKLADEMYNQLKQDAPLANDRQLRDKANSTALSYVQGQIKSFTSDPTYNRPEDKEEVPAARNYTAHVLPTEKTGVTPATSKELVEKYENSLANKFEIDPKTVIRGTDSDEQYGLRLAALEMQNRSRALNRESALKPFKQHDSWNELTSKYGLSEKEAVNVIANEMSSKPLTSKMTLFPVDKTAVNGTLLDDIGTHINTFDMGDIEVIDYKGNSKKTSRSSYEKALKTAISKGTIQNVSIDVKGDKIRLYDDSNTTYAIPITSIGNEGTRQVIRDYSSIMSILYGDKEGESKIPVILGDKVVVARKAFDPKLKKYVSNLIDINTLTDIPIETIADRLFTDVFSTYGVLDRNQYGTEKIRKVQYQSGNSDNE